MKPEPPAGLWEKMEAIHAHHKLSDVPNDPGFTVVEYAARFGLTESGAGTRLRKLLKSGDLLKGWRMVEGRKQVVYRPA